MGVGTWSDKVDVGDVKVTRSTAPAALIRYTAFIVYLDQLISLRLLIASASPSQVSVWSFETLKPWHMLDPASSPVTYNLPFSSYSSAQRLMTSSHPSLHQHSLFQFKDVEESRFGCGCSGSTLVIVIIHGGSWHLWPHAAWPHHRCQSSNSAHPIIRTQSQHPVHTFLTPAFVLNRGTYCHSNQN